MNRLYVLLTATLCTSAALAQGYFDFGQIPGVADNPKVQIDLNPVMLAFVGEAARVADPASGDLISGIENVRVRVYETTNNVDDLLEFIDDTSGQLESDGWQRTVFVDDEESKVRVYMKFDDNNATGLTLMVAGEDDEAVFINVAGLINPTELGQLMNTLGAGDAIRGLTNVQQRNGSSEPAPTDADD